MIKYLILSAIGYYIFVHYLSPLLEGNKTVHQQKTERTQNQKHDDEYIDYEEVE
ncbi:MAG: hypothetical protein U0T36_05150 [Saprospiraceae bacterium]|mgnify:FL=1|jgi:hypothetical protein